MEIETAPRHPAATPWGRLLLFVVVLGPVTLFVLLPIGLGLDRYVMTGDSMTGGVSRGSIAFERVVPVSDLRVGDVISFPQPGSAGAHSLVTHRIVAIGPDGIRTRGDSSSTSDPWTLHPEESTMSRVEFTIPWIGWAYLFLVGPPGWVVTLASAAVLLLLLRREWRRQPDRQRRTAGPPPQPVSSNRE